jgi:hypothetical protein
MVFTYPFLYCLTVPPQIIPFDFTDDPVNSEDMSSLTCTVSKGDFPIAIVWTLNNRSVDTVQGISVMRTNKRISQLSIDSVQAEHAGEFTCSAKNPAGTAAYSAILHVNGTTKILFLCFSTSSNHTF